MVSENILGFQKWRKKLKEAQNAVKKIFSVASDPCWTLEQWQKFLSELIKKHGKDSVLFSDASYNNVELVLSTSKKK